MFPHVFARQIHTKSLNKACILALSLYLSTISERRLSLMRNQAYKSHPKSHLNKIASQIAAITSSPNSHAEYAA